MKKCLKCKSNYASENLSCQTCGYEPDKVDGIIKYSLESNHDNCGFKTSYFAELSKLEAGHFWFRARNRLILWATAKYCSEFKSYLEIGCGTGYVLDGIAKAFPCRQLYGSEIFIDGLFYARDRQPNINFMQMDARQIPFIDEFDVIGAFDVLEHIHEDDLVLKQIHDALHVGGMLLLTVPQHHFLWSPVDSFACHVRRYSAEELYSKLTKAGFDILRSTSFVTILLPVMILSRIVQTKKKSNCIDIIDVLRISSWLNKLFEIILRIEIFFISCGLNLPFGGSRIAIVRKRQ